MQTQHPLDPRVTADGSFTFFSEDFGECFHSHHGAYQEAVGKFVLPTRLASQAHQPRLYILDICYGLGYNTAAALEAIWEVNPDCHIELLALESDLSVPQAAIAQGWLQRWAKRIQHPLIQLAQTGTAQTQGLTARLLVGDARQMIQQVRQQDFQAQAVFLDPFSPPKCPQLWTVEFFRQVRYCVHPQGRLATYSCAAAVRAGLLATGWHVGSTTPVGRRSPGTVASVAVIDSPPLSASEQESLQTRAAVPYRDPTLQATAIEILERRRREQMMSSLEPTRRWKQRWSGRV